MQCNHNARLTSTVYHVVKNKKKKNKRKMIRFNVSVNNISRY